MGKRSVKAKDRLLVVLIIICAAIAGVSAYMLISYHIDGQNTEQSFEDLRPPRSADLPEEVVENTYDSLMAHYRKLYDKNSDFVGWLRIYGTGIDYPVMQTKSDRDYYLHRDFKKRQNNAGCLFASDITDIERPSDVTIVFGHMMNNGSMFGELKGYNDQKYMDKHPIIRFDTLKESRYYRVFCALTTATNTGKDDEFKYYQASDFLDKVAFDRFILESQNRAVCLANVNVKYGDQLIALSTCEYTHKDGRLVVLGKRLTMEELWALGSPWNKIPDVDGNVPKAQ